MPAPTYISQANVAGLETAPQSQINPGAAVERSAQAFGAAAGGFGQSLLQVGGAIAHVNRATTLAERQTNHATALDQLAEEYRNDPDQATAAQRFQERAAKLEGEALRGLGMEDAAELQFKLRKQTISYLGSVRTNALQKQGDSFAANTDKQFELTSRRYALAGSEAERKAIADEFDATVAGGVTNGMMTAQRAEAYKLGLRTQGDQAVIYRMIGNDPVAAQKALADPAQFAGLNPVQREQMALHARQVNEELANQRMGILTKTDPGAAAAMIGRVTSLGQVSAIFDKAFIPQESGGDPNAHSGKGAAGISQMMPDTARMVAKRMGIGDWSGLSDAEVQQKLKDDPQQARQMGIQHFFDLIKEGNGHLVYGAVAYHAGSGVAKKAYQATVAKYGDNFTPEQFLEFVPAIHDGTKEKPGKYTADYARDIFKRLGGSTNGMGLSQQGYYRVVSTVGNELQRQASLEEATARQFFNQGHAQVNQFVDFLNKGMTPNPEELAAVESRLRAGVMRGIPEAIDDLKKLQTAKDMQPHVLTAKNMRIEDLTANVAQMEQEQMRNASIPGQQRLSVFKAALDAKVKLFNTDQIGLAEMQGAPVTALNAQTALADPGLAKDLHDRALISRGINMANGGQQHFFRPNEKEQWQQRLQQADENEKFKLLSTIADAAKLTKEGGGIDHRTANLAVSELTKGDKMAEAAAMFVNNNPELSRRILRGATLMQLDGVKEKADEMRGAMKAVWPKMPYPDSVKANLTDAALAVYADKRSRNGTLWDTADRAGIEDAFAEVLGPMTKVNGANVPIPRGVPEWQIREFMSSGMLDKTLDAAGGAYGFNNDKFPASFIGRHAQLRPVDAELGNHRYYQMFIPTADGKGRPLFTRDNKPLVIDLPQVVKQHSLDLEDARAAGTLLARRLNRAGPQQYPRDIPLPRPAPPQPFDGVQIP